MPDELEEGIAIRSKTPPTSEEVKVLPKEEVEELIYNHSITAKRACMKCTYWRSGEKFEGKPVIGECHFHPPVTDFVWPKTQLFDWCSQFKEA